MTTKTCENCTHGNDVGLTSYRRECRRHAPSTAPGHGVMPPAQWPIVANSDWCGDFEAKLQPKRPPRVRRYSAAQDWRQT